MFIQQSFFSLLTHKFRVNNLIFLNIVFIQQLNNVRKKLFDRINILTFDFKKRRFSLKFSQNFRDTIDLFSNITFLKMIKNVHQISIDKLNFINFFVESFYLKIFNFKKQIIFLKLKKKAS